MFIYLILVLLKANKIIPGGFVGSRFPPTFHNYSWSCWDARSAPQLWKAGELTSLWPLDLKKVTRNRPVAAKQNKRNWSSSSAKTHDEWSLQAMISSTVSEWRDVTAGSRWSTADQLACSMSSESSATVSSTTRQPFVGEAFRSFRPYVTPCTSVS